MMLHVCAAAAALSSAVQQSHCGHPLSSCGLASHVAKSSAAWPVALPPSWSRASASPQGARTSAIVMVSAADRARSFAVLGVQPGASHAELKDAYRKRAKKLHPDVNPTEQAANEFQELTKVRAHLC